MPKTFITERDIDDMKTQGVTSFDVTDNIVLTDLAVERAVRHGIKLKRAELSAPPKASYSQSVNLVAAFPRATVSDAEIIQKVKSMVLAKLDGQVDAALLDAVIARVVSAMK
jgi:hypothetical protein